MGLLRSWMGPERHKRPANYLNQDAHLASYLAYYFPLHLPELFWILDQGKARGADIQPKRVLDVGSGPGTLSFSLFFWLQKEKKNFPEELVLWDQSETALKFAKDKLRSTFLNNAQPKNTDLKNTAEGTRIRFEKVHLPRMPKEEKKFDLIIVGHVLNEWGAGPRFRDKKLSLIKQLQNMLTSDGSLIVVEPPLREATLDLMVMRDELIRDFQVVAPCPQSFEGCPLLKDKLGWCYAQPSRAAMGEFGFTVFDKHIERLLSIQLTQQSFSYLWLRKKTAAFELMQTAIAVTDKNSPRHKICVASGKLNDTKKVPAFRGEASLSS